MAKYLLHGTLHVTIYEAADLVNRDRKTGAAPKILRKFIESAEDAVGLGKGYSRYYATVDLETSRVGRSRILPGHEPRDPVWNESFRIYCAHCVSEVRISIKDAAVVGTAVVGRARVLAAELLSGKVVDSWYHLYKDNGGQLKDARIRFRLQFFEASHEHNWGMGVGDAWYPGVPYCFFPQRKGCRLTLYQDAHMPDNFLPPIYLAGNSSRQPTRCWEDVFEAISNARHLIYISGWSIYTEITLVRDPRRQIPGSDGVTLGELLKRKADEGVRVNLLVWDDRTSVGFMKGIMSTHDEETMIYFQNTNVNCCRCPRNPDQSLSVVQGMTIGTMFTHHQKIIIVDAPVPVHYSDNRRLVSFVGGIDLCDGRYDTQYHSLFHTLNNVHSKDFHQTNFTGASLECGGPREPWHDIHCKLEGPAAWDVLYNFEQRWRKQAGQNKESLLLPIQDMYDIDPPTGVTTENDPDTWHVQVFRSIDAGAASGFPSDPEDAAKAGLVSGKDNTIDRSIQDAYINAIRRAKNFIYIENQYFLGSCFAWDTKKECGAEHLIPIELALKIVSKIERGERFAVYVVLPMWPEGVPESGSVQAILDWQKRTMEMMYKEIANALHARQIYDQSPKDYLTFFCLGNRETRLEGDFVPTRNPENSNYKSAQENRRFMIYVHAKMMIVDDEYIIVGSANINQRSMDGARDSEIAMGAYQPYHLVAHQPPVGQVHGFRMSLWYEHMGRLDNAFLQPWSLDCIRQVNHIGEELWDMFVGEAVVDLPGHLLTYPVAVANDGSVSELPGRTYFPDTKARVLGTLSEFLPEILTT